MLDGSRRAWAAVQQDAEGPAYALRIAVCSLASLALYAAGVAVKRVFPQSAIAKRPTVIYNFAHSLMSSSIAFASLRGLVPLSYWPHYGLPITIGYFVCDTLVWCLPNFDVGMLVHHGVSVAVHIAVGVPLGASIAGAGDAEWAIRTSAFVYLIEASVVLLTTRWYLIQTLEGPSKLYTFNNVLLLLFWSFGRIGLVVYNALSILPRRTEYAKAGATDIVYIFVFAHMVIFAMSFFWLMTLLKEGLGAYLFFNPKAKPKIITEWVVEGDEKKFLLSKKKKTTTASKKLE